MATWIDQNCDPDELVNCDCGGTSDTTHFTRCPFCGDEEVELVDGTTVDGKQLALTYEPISEADAEDPRGTPAPIIILTEATLDKSVKAICTLKEQMAKNYHRLGVMLRAVHDSGLWKMRMSKDGAPKYTEFGQWTRAEVGLGRTQAMKCLEVASNFSEGEVQEIGHTRLAIALQVPSEYRDRLVAQAREGASKRELEREAAVVKGRLPDRVPEVKSPGDQDVTILVTSAKRQIDFMADDGSSELAFCIADCPIATEMLANDVVVTYRILEGFSDGRLILEIERKRLDA